MAKEIIVILGNQLVHNHPALTKHPDATVVMIEADDICRTFRYHKHKLLLVLSAMRSYRDSLKHSVEYIAYKPGSVFTDELTAVIKKQKATRIIWMHASDRGPNRMLNKLASEHDAEAIVYANKQFLTSTSQFGGWLDSTKSANPLMETFYRWQRKRLMILVDKNGNPEGGSWNYDHDNRQPLPKDFSDSPTLPKHKSSKHVSDVASILNKHFADHPGSTSTFWLPTTRTEARKWLRDFIKTRLSNFGAYEDAMKQNEPFLYHSVLSPLINLGLLLPNECVDEALAAYKSGDAPLNSVEGFIRQIIGWREFMYGLYWWKYDDFNRNFFGFIKPLESWWYNDSFANENLPLPLDDVLKRAHQYGYNHHIERLMVLGNWFLLSQYDPKSVYNWFMSMYVDAYEWVMIPNVIGMSQYADGGMLATKPYVSGGNYLQKMGRWWPTTQAAKDSEYTKLYWKFLHDNRTKFENNQRMSLVLSQVSKHIT